MSFADLIDDVDSAVIDVLGEPEPVMYAPAVGPAVPVTGVFDEQYVLVKSDGNSSVETVGPAVFLKLADLPTDPRVDKPLLTIGGVVYRVHERKPAGMGSIVLALRRVS